MLYPLLWMVSSSIKPTAIIFRDPSLWPSRVDLSNYVKGWTALDYPFQHYIVNSTIIAVGAIVGNLLSCSMAAYAFARLDFWGKKVFFATMLTTLMLPIHVMIVPQYVLFSKLGWLNTYLPLIVPKFLATDAFFVFLMVQFIRSLPRELDDAARIDGCGHVRIFWRIIMPLCIPALATTAVFTFIWTWNDFYQPAHLPHRPESVHGAGRTTHIHGRTRTVRVGPTVCDVRRRLGADLRFLPRRTALSHPGNRHDRPQVTCPKSSNRKAPS